MSKILIINAGKQLGHSNCELNHTLSDVAYEALLSSGHAVKLTEVDRGMILKPK